MADSFEHAPRWMRRSMIWVPKPPHPPVTRTWPSDLVTVVARASPVAERGIVVQS